MKIIISVILLAFISCKSKNTSLKVKEETLNENNEFLPNYALTSPHILIYKTKNDYNNLVPVLLSENKDEIISYPHPQDLIIGDEFSSPIILEKKYLIDRRGINKNVAFLNMTYQEYSKLENPPTIDELMNLIIDKDPITELCDCGIKTEQTTKAFFDQLIKEEKLKTTCKVLK